MADNKKSSLSKRSGCYLLNLKQPATTSRRLRLSFQRTAGKIFVLKANREVEATIGFLDISETGVGVFTPELLHKGSLVELCVTEPAILKVRGIVAWSIPVASGIHNGRFGCRSGIQFFFDSETQQKAVQEFVFKVGLDPIESLKAASKSSTALEGNNATDPVPSQPAAIDASAAPAPATAPVAVEGQGASPAVAESPAPAPQEATPAVAVEGEKKAA